MICSLNISTLNPFPQHISRLPFHNSWLHGSYCTELGFRTQFSTYARALWTQSPRHNMISLFPSHLPFLLLCLVLMISLIGSNCNELGLEMQIHWCLNLLTHFLINYKYKIRKHKEYQIQITQYQIKMKNTEFKIQNTKHKIQSTENKL